VGGLILTVTLKSETKQIRGLNYCFRQSFIGGQVYLTSGVGALDDGLETRVLTAVREFNDFDEGNDPNTVARLQVDGCSIRKQVQPPRSNRSLFIDLKQTLHRPGRLVCP
jgi:hypothetical protein